MPAAIPIAAATMAPDEVGDDSLIHADYNLQPLLVKSLDHYIAPADENERERFHIR
jgi:hypothetical protein